MTAENAPYLPGFDPTPPKDSTPGFIEQETLRQIEALRSMGYIEDHHAGQVALAITTARALDQAQGRGAPSGYANLTRAMKEIFETLPAPEAASADALTKVLDFLMSDQPQHDSEEVDH
ncbi:hypothetical protein [Microbacterium sp. NPDC087665]|uniref:hypothetical protein n=1 Tax=Microbacterium sp. NPDC087665 TaxID=3364194 RepID=UPI0037FAB73D